MTESPKGHDERRATISVILLTYNQARYVESCLETIAGQTSTDWELIVADDASVDGALEVARSVARRTVDPVDGDPPPTQPRVVSNVERRSCGR